MAKQTITAIFDGREYANNAVLMLNQAGVPNSDVTISPEAAATGYANDAEPRVKGFWSSLEEMFGGTDDHSTYAEGVRRGGVLVTAHVDEAKVDNAVEILERHGSVDLNERETTWRSEGWTGSPVITGGGIADEGAGPLRSMTPVTKVETDRAAVGVLSTPSSAQAYRAGIAPVSKATDGKSASRDDVIQVAEESISVGKRALNRGKVRVHSYVVETPFVQDVSLRDETVTIDRRPVDRVATAADLGLNPFQDRVIEMEEIDEEAVVAKTARVVEEIGIRKDVADRTQTITDTVRSTKVDIEDGRTVGRATTLFADTSSMQRAKDLEVVGSDGHYVGTVDHVDGTTIKLKRLDPGSGGSHHLIPTDWVQMVDGKVTLKVTAADAKSRWTAV